MGKGFPVELILYTICIFFLQTIYYIYTIYIIFCVYILILHIIKIICLSYNFFLLLYIYVFVFIFLDRTTIHKYINRFLHISEFPLNFCLLFDGFTIMSSLLTININILYKILHYIILHSKVFFQYMYIIIYMYVQHTLAYVSN